MNLPRAFERNVYSFFPRHAECSLCINYFKFVNCLVKFLYVLIFSFLFLISNRISGDLPGRNFRADSLAGKNVIRRNITTPSLVFSQFCLPPQSVGEGGRKEL